MVELISIITYEFSRIKMDDFDEYFKIFDEYLMKNLKSLDSFDFRGLGHLAVTL
jgi:nucleoid DNA-binding protein